MTKIVGYNYLETTHCVGCAKADLGNRKILPIHPPLTWGIDEQGMPHDLVDEQSNLVYPVYEGYEKINCNQCNVALT